DARVARRALFAVRQAALLVAVADLVVPLGALAAGDAGGPGDLRQTEIGLTRDGDGDGRVAFARGGERGKAECAGEGHGDDQGGPRKAHGRTSSSFCRPRLAQRTAAPCYAPDVTSGKRDSADAGPFQRRDSADAGPLQQGIEAKLAAAFAPEHIVVEN